MCMAAGIDPPADVFVHGWLLVGGQKLSKTLVRQAAEGERPVKLTEIAPEALTSDFGVDAVRYHLLRDIPLGHRRRVLLRGHGRPVQRRSGQQPGQPGGPGGHGGRRPSAAGSGRPPTRRARWPTRPRAAVAAAADAWGRFAPHEALEATWRLIGAANAELEATEPWKSDPGPAVDAVLGSALEALRIVALLVTPAMPATAAEIWRRIGLDGTPAERRLPVDAAWGGYPGGLTVEKGAPLFPRRKG